MKHIILATAALAFGVAALPSSVDAEALPGRKSDAERKSKNGELKAKVGGAMVTVAYGRPEVRGRKVWGDLVPYGKTWRTGADEATVIAFDKDVMIEGKKLAAGAYALFTIPDQKEWTVVFNREPKQWGAYKHDASKDALRVKVKPEASKHAEALTFEADAKRVTLRWEKVAVSFNVKAG